MLGTIAIWISIPPDVHCTMDIMYPQVTNINRFRMFQKVVFRLMVSVCLYSTLKKFFVMHTYSFLSVRNTVRHKKI